MQKPCPLTREEFARWLIGFIDAEGNFQVFLDRSYLRVAFRIVLHVDDIEVLYTIQRHLNIGSVRSSGYSCIFSTTKISDIDKVLIPLLETFSLRTTKLYDYHDFKDMVKLLLSLKNSRVEGVNLEHAKQVIAGMNTGRGQSNVCTLPKDPIDPLWFGGFLEGEATFGFKNLVPYFQIGQHLRINTVLDKIELFLKTLPNAFNFTLNPLFISNTIHKFTGVRVISNNNIDALHDYLAFFLLSLPFQTRKNVDFMYWCLVLHMHKFGHFYLPMPRKLVVDISKYINTARYSNAHSTAVEPSINKNIFTEPLPIILTPEMSHLKLGQLYAKRITDRSVWIYDKNILVTTSPYSSYSAALISINLPSNSSIIKRYIDTGKVYTKRYTFYSKQQ